MLPIQSVTLHNCAHSPYWVYQRQRSIKSTKTRWPPRHKINLVLSHGQWLYCFWTWIFTSARVGSNTGEASVLDSVVFTLCQTRGCCSQVTRGLATDSGQVQHDCSASTHQVPSNTFNTCSDRSQLVRNWRRAIPRITCCQDKEGPGKLDGLNEGQCRIAEQSNG
jgi:hypothetical protein